LYFRLASYSETTIQKNELKRISKNIKYHCSAIYAHFFSIKKNNSGCEQGIARIWNIN